MTKTKATKTLTAIVKTIDEPRGCRWYQRATFTIGRTAYEACFLTDDEGIEENNTTVYRVYRMKDDKVNGIRNGVSIELASNDPATLAVARALRTLKFDHRDGKAVFNTLERWEDLVETSLRDAPKSLRTRSAVLVAGEAMEITRQLLNDGRWFSVTPEPNRGLYRVVVKDEDGLPAVFGEKGAAE
jgi:hypothetical protein